MSGLREYRNEIRWTIVVVVLAVLGIVALWPRGAEQPAEPGAPAPAPVAAQRGADPALRASAALEPCPSGPPTGPPGATGTCLADGRPADLAAMVGGRTTLVNVWATWCQPCRTELPALQEYSRRPGAVPVVGVQVQSDEDDGLALLRELGVRYPNVHDPDNRIRAALNVPAVLPMSYVVTASGEVRRVDPPVAFESADEVRTAVQRTAGGAG
ncbi:thiol-disulfide isomerase/thioredoxin [Saccharopolyspora erythraea NRRL 2338]|uniref:Redoxin n=3 Tax=Saccharopolyspora erythraea TaxID=1836 RepID=A4F6K7_SACEN|nr:TlpA disulfide reductase family protein [Saccharopolyspora erythraea]PFG93484.1 thiol-disulfide isomerase/thioredoxin [Saccharopolyspora erythraea NRRL 2338]CAL99681.1 redoxin [Saccharopolyspora erythraea NRRL 2338]